MYYFMFRIFIFFIKMFVLEDKMCRELVDNELVLRKNFFFGIDILLVRI